MAAARFQLVLLTVLVAFVLCAALAPAPAAATEESDDTADDGTITTVLQPGWNMIGWLGGDTDASELFDQVPNLKRVSAWVSLFVRHRLPSLEEVEEDAAFDALPTGVGYRMGLVAVDWLVRRSSEQAPVEFFEALTRTLSWHEAFEGVFGITVDEFYKAFEAHIAEVAPPLPHLTDDSDEPLIEFVGDVPLGTQAAVRREFTAIHAFFGERFGTPPLDYTAYATADQASLEARALSVFGRAPSEESCVWTIHALVTIVDVGCLSAPYDLDWTYFRSLRWALAPTASLPRTPDGFDVRGPVWLTEAIETYVEHAYEAAARRATIGALRDTEISRAMRTTQLLADMVTRDGFNEDFWAAMAAGFLAVEWLTDRSGDPAIFDYYRLLTESETWEEAFEAAFDIAVDDFYEEFAAYRAEVAPPVS